MGLPPPAAAPPPALPAPAAHRSAIEHALVEVSHLLVASGDVDLREVLRILASAVEAELAFFVPAPPDDAFDEAPRPPVVVWHRDGATAEREWLNEDTVAATATRRLATATAAARRSCYVAPRVGEHGPSGIAIPLLSRGDLFVGYLGVEHTALPPDALREYGRVLSVFGDLLVSHLGRTRAEQALRESEDRWRRLVVSHPEPILITAGPLILYANEACARLFGEGDPADLLHRSLRDFLPAEQYELAEGRPAAGHLIVEHEIIRLDGEHRLVEAVSNPVAFKGHAARQTVLRDVTERKRSEERYRTFVQTISEGVWCLDLDHPVSTLAHPRVQADLVRRHGVLTECNAMMTRLMGASRPEAVLGRHVADLLPELDGPLLEAFVEGGYRVHNRELTVQRDGHPRHFSINAVGRVERDALVRIWGSCVEVTDRVELEQRMVAVLEEQQERIARDLHDSVGQLLTGIRMLSENLGARHFQPGAEGHDVARRMTTYAEEALQRVREICRGLVPPQLYQEGLATALAGLVATLDGLGGVSCTFLHDGRCDVSADDAKLQLYRIAQEATQNALKHARSRHVWIHLYDERGAVVLEVEDDGVGFDAERSAGRTLGLYSMQRRASSVQAALTIEAAPGTGTTVRVVLPEPREAPTGP